MAPDASEALAAAAAISDLRARQEFLHRALLARPDDLELMFAYAQVSIALEDYEGAISTLERMLIYRQDLARVRLELAVAYFSLGSYEVADLYFDQVLDDPGTPVDVRDRIARYKEVIATRTRRSVFTGGASLGLTYATNATLGPDDAFVQFLGTPTRLVAGGEEDDFGVRATFDITHILDLERPNDDVWISEASLFGLRYFDEEVGNGGYVRLRTGPRLALDNQTFGPKLRPYLEASYLNADDESLYFAYGGGLQYTNTLDNYWSVYGDAAVLYQNYDIGSRADESSLSIRGLVGAAFVPMRDLILRGALLAERDAAEGDFNSNTEVGLRLSAEHGYDSGLAFVDRKWTVSAYGEVRGRFFDDPDPVIDPNETRRDLDLRGGISNHFAIRDGFGLQLDVDALWRQSNISNFDLDNVSVTLSAQYRF